MPNTGLADFSNVTLVLAIVLYAVAMLAYACDFAFGNRQAAATSSARPQPARVEAGVLVGAASGTELAGHAFPADPGDPTELADLSGGADLAGPGTGGTRTRGTGTGSTGAGGSAASGRVEGDAAAGTAGAAGGGGFPPGSARSGLPEPALMAARPSLWPEGTWLRGAFLLTCAGLALHIASVASRGLAEHRVPWGNMYEFIAAITCSAVLVLVVGMVRFRAYYLGLFVLVPVVLALAVDVVVIYMPAGQLVPALQSYWIAIHVTAMIVAIGTYIFGAVVTVLYLLVSRYERQVAAGETSAAAGIWDRLPHSEVLDRLAYRAILFAFPAWTFAVIAGAIWADHAWGRYWGWDPKETWSFITWLVYAAFLHARATAGWRGRRAAFIHLFGFTCLLFNLVGVNLWITGLHSYAGMG
ncbi:MAG TPA: c-type cytochrome biogenesis protein CcsB [Streptosporangiaceae bacterium]|nr:c-type cytochrome biogenesis protein CcsB [Streptosporangiaceae bacterium]